MASHDERIDFFYMRRGDHELAMENLRWFIASMQGKVDEESVHRHDEGLRRPLPELRRRRLGAEFAGLSSSLCSVLLPQNLWICCGEQCMVTTASFLDPVKKCSRWMAATQGEMGDSRSADWGLDLVTRKELHIQLGHFVGAEMAWSWLRM